MKKTIILIVSLAVFVLTANAFAFEGTRGEAIASIKGSLQDPEISAWVKETFKCPEKLFMMAVKMAPDKTVKDIADSFIDAQQAGGADLNRRLSLTTETWVWIILGMLILLLILVA